MNENTTARARQSLQHAGYYPTPNGVAMMQDPEEQGAARRDLVEMIARLTPGDLLAVWVYVASLLWRQSGEY